MSEYLFLDKETEPAEKQLQDALSSSFKYWEEIQNKISSKYGEIIPEWKFYTKKTGWIRKSMLKNRNLFFFKPYDKCFILTFVFGDRAVKEIEISGIDHELIQELLSARKYAEGRGLSVKVTKRKDLVDIYKLIDIKINN